MMENTPKEIIAPTESLLRAMGYFGTVSTAVNQGETIDAILETIGNTIFELGILANSIQQRNSLLSNAEADMLTISTYLLDNEPTILHESESVLDAAMHLLETKGTH